MTNLFVLSLKAGHTNGMNNFHASLRSGLSVLCGVLAVIVPVGYQYAYAGPVTQVLDSRRSKVQFGVDSPSPSLTMNGSFRSYTGNLRLDPQDLTRSQVAVSLNLSSAQLPPDQILQNVFLQTALSRIRQKETTFQSDSITKQPDGTYLVSGTYEWLSKVKRAAFPVQVVKMSPSLTEIRLLLNGSLKQGQDSQEVKKFAPMALGSKGWAKANLVFHR